MSVQHLHRPKNYCIESDSEWVIEANEEKDESGVRKQVISCFGNMGGDNTKDDIHLICAAPKMLSSLEYTENKLRETAARLRVVEKNKKGYSLLDAEVIANILEDIANGNIEAIGKAKTK